MPRGVQKEFCKIVGMAKKFILIRGILAILAGSSALALIAGVVLYISKQKAKPRPGITLEDLGNEHVREITAPHKSYNSIPPTSGPHLPRIAPWGIAEVQVPDELIVHNMEDGGIIMSYDPVRIASKDIEKLKGLIGTYDDQILMHPYTKPELPSPIVLTAWTKLLTLESFDEAKIREFITAYRGIDHHEQK